MRRASLAGLVLTAGCAVARPPAASAPPATATATAQQVRESWATSSGGSVQRATPEQPAPGMVQPLGGASAPATAPATAPSPAPPAEPSAAPPAPPRPSRVGGPQDALPEAERPEGALARYEAQLRAAVARISADAATCRDLCGASATICRAAGEICRLTQDADRATPRDPAAETPGWPATTPAVVATARVRPALTRDDARRAGATFSRVRRRPLLPLLGAALLFGASLSAQTPGALPPPPPPDPAAYPPPPPPDAAPAPTSTAPAPATPSAPAAPDATTTTPGEAADVLAPAPRAAARRPGLWRERLRILNASLPPMAERSRDARRTDILVNSISGAVTIGLGFVFSARDDGSPHPAQVLLWSQGGLLLAQGLAALAFPPARERLSDEFAAMPQNTVRLRHARVRFGEEALDRMAADGTRRRVINAVVGIAAALIPVGVIYSDQLFNGRPWPEPPELNVIAVSISGIAVVQALVPLFTRSPEERLRDEYRARIRMLREGAEDPD
ncbi:MAG: hypothetical protein U0325_13330 [Polyangiales bacterium]